MPSFSLSSWFSAARNARGVKAERLSGKSVQQERARQDAVTVTEKAARGHVSMHGAESARKVQILGLFRSCPADAINAGHSPAVVTSSGKRGRRTCLGNALSKPFLQRRLNWSALRMFLQDSGNHSRSRDILLDRLTSEPESRLRGYEESGRNTVAKAVAVDLLSKLGRMRTIGKYPEQATLRKLFLKSKQPAMFGNDDGKYAASYDETVMSLGAVLKSLADELETSGDVRRELRFLAREMMRNDGRKKPHPAALVALLRHADPEHFPLNSTDKYRCNSWASTDSRTSEAPAAETVSDIIDEGSRPAVPRPLSRISEAETWEEEDGTHAGNVAHESVTCHEWNGAQKPTSPIVSPSASIEALRSKPPLRVEWETWPEEAGTELPIPYGSPHDTCRTASDAHSLDGAEGQEAWFTPPSSPAPSIRTRSSVETFHTATGTLAGEAEAERDAPGSPRHDGAPDGSRN